MVGKQVQVTADGVPSGDIDLVLSITDPDGNVVADEIDNDISPEIYAATIKKAGTYTVTVAGFAGETGPFTLDVSPIVTPSKTTTDFNLLFFSEDGEFLGATTEENPLTGRPNESFDLEGPGKVQMVIARAGTGPVGATRLRNIMFDDIYNGEYDNPLAPGISGHALARGANAVAAYDVQAATPTCTAVASRTWTPDRARTWPRTCWSVPPVVRSTSSGTTRSTSMVPSSEIPTSAARESSAHPMTPSRSPSTPPRRWSVNRCSSRPTACPRARPTSS